MNRRKHHNQYEASQSLSVSSILTKRKINQQFKYILKKLQILKPPSAQYTKLMVNRSNTDAQEAKFFCRMQEFAHCNFTKQAKEMKNIEHLFLHPCYGFCYNVLLFKVLRQTNNINERKLPQIYHWQLFIGSCKYLVQTVGFIILDSSRRFESHLNPIPFSISNLPNTGWSCLLIHGCLSFSPRLVKEFNPSYRDSGSLMNW